MPQIVMSVRLPSNDHTTTLRTAEPLHHARLGSAVLTNPPASFTNDPAEFGAQIRELADRVEAQLLDSAPIIRPSQARMG
jgi:hypothetical protein